MRDVNPSTQYLILEIHVELTIPGDRASIRGLHTELTVEEILQRPRLHLEESGAASWDARFRMQRNAGRIRSPDERLVQILVHVRMMERIPNPDMLLTRQFVHAVAHAQIANPYTESTRAQFTHLGEERFRNKFWATACLTLRTMVIDAHLPNLM